MHVHGAKSFNPDGRPALVDVYAYNVYAYDVYAYDVYAYGVYA